MNFIKYKEDTDRKINTETVYQYIERQIITLYEEDKIQKKITDLRNKEVKELLFDDYLIMVDNANKKNQSIMNFFKKEKK